MAKVTLRPEIIGISGKVGNMVFKTYKNGQVRLYKAPSYQRKTSVTNAERQARSTFALRCKRVTQLMADGLSKQEAWDIAKNEIR